MGNSWFLVAVIILVIIPSSPGALTKFKDSFPRSLTSFEKKELEALTKFKHSFTHSSTSCRKKELEALTKFKHSFTHDPYGHLSSWVGDDCCHWSGVACDNVTTNVIHLDLSLDTDHGFYYMSLVSSELSPALLELEFLTHLDLSSNNFSGSHIPKFIGSMTNLTTLNLGYAEFSGPVPQEIGNLTNLIYLDISSGEQQSKLYTAESMEWASNLSKLQTLHLGNVEMSESSDALRVLFRLPSLSELFLNGCGLHKTHLTELLIINTISSPLRQLDLGDNNLEGHFPSFLQNVSSLQSLSLGDNSFSGSVPPWLGNMSQLEILDLGRNRLNGRVPPVFAHFTKTNYLDLSHNGFQGPVPASLARFPALKHLDLSYNKFNGLFPDVLGNLTKIDTLDISSNYIHGTIFGIGNLSKLTNLDLSFNNINLNLDFTPFFQIQFLMAQSCKINAVFPKWLGNQTQLMLLDLTNTGISGEFSKWILNMTNLGVLELGHNQLTGVIYEGENGFPALDSLYWLDLSDNKLSGKIHVKDPLPYAYLEVLRLRGNDFSGFIPLQLCGFRQLEILELSFNRFNGPIPSCLGSLPFAGYFLSYEYNIETQEIIKGILEKLDKTTGIHSMIDLSSNQLVGTIPIELANLSKLMQLNLSNNQLTGVIPMDIGNLHTLESLDLSNNELSGTIPQSLSNIPWITALNLSNNNLHGPIPSGNQLQTLVDPSSYAGNHNLCGFPLPNCLNKIKAPSSQKADGREDKMEDKYEKMWLYMVIMSGVAAGFWGVVGALVFKKSWRHAYFRYVEEMTDKIYVPVKVRMDRLKNRMAKNDNAENSDK